MDDTDETRDDLTEEEREISAEVDATPDEAHRIGEFDELRALLGDVLREVQGVREDVGKLIPTVNAITVDNGATVTDTSDDEIIVTDEEPENPFERDYTIDR